MSVEPYSPGMLNPRTDGWTAVVEQVAQFAVQIQDTELVPVALRKKPAAIAAVILYGREIGLPPMTALRTSYVVNGRVALAAETLRALVLAAGHEIAYEESTTARCVAAGKRRGTDTWHSVEWNLDLARKAGIAGGQSWQRYPRQMLKARATAELCRDLFPDVIGGFEAVEEIDDNPNGATVAAAPDTTGRRTVRRQQAPAGGEPTGHPGVPTPASPVAAAAPPAGPPRGAGEPDATRPNKATGGTAPDAVTTAGGPGQVPLPGEDGYDDLAVPGNVTSGEGGKPETPRRDTGPWPITEPQSKKLHAMLGQLGIRDRELGLAFLSLAAGRPIDTSKELTRAEAVGIIDFLTLAETSDELTEQITQIVTDPNPIAALNQFAGMFGTGEEEPPADPGEVQ